MCSRLIIIRGLPGSGKSTLAKTYPTASHYEADMYFIDENGNYNYNPSKIKQAHEWCQNQVKNDIESGKKIVVVSNTFTTKKEMQYYIDLKKFFPSLDIIIYRTEKNYESIHNVPLEVIEKMKNRFENIENEIIIK